MADNSNIVVDSNVAPVTMSGIKLEAEQFLLDMESGFSELTDTIVNSEGDFIDALKAQINGELEMVRAACAFFDTLLLMMQAADEDFATLDSNYAQEKIN